MLKSKSYLLNENIIYRSTGIMKLGKNYLEVKLCLYLQYYVERVIFE